MRLTEDRGSRPCLTPSPAAGAEVLESGVEEAGYGVPVGIGGAGVVVPAIDPRSHQ